jgi:sugar-specific transcriptional regulator TrmB
MIHALDSLTPGALWAFEEETYEKLVWLDEEIIKPTEAEIKVEIIRLQAEYEHTLAEQEAEAVRLENAKQSAISKLSKLGLTEDEAKAVIGL